MDKLLYTVAEVQALTGLGKWKLYDLIRDGSLRSVKIGACRRIRPTRCGTSSPPSRRSSRHE